MRASNLQKALSSPHPALERERAQGVQPLLRDSLPTLPRQEAGHGAAARV